MSSKIRAPSPPRNGLNGQEINIIIDLIENYANTTQKRHLKQFLERNIGSREKAKSRDVGGRREGAAPSPPRPL